MDCDAKGRQTLAELYGCMLVVVLAAALVWWASGHTPRSHDTGLRTPLLLALASVGVSILCILDVLTYRRSRLATAGILAGLVSSTAWVALVLHQV
jgi:apolipoprotein N-acyltransferase